MTGDGSTPGTGEVVAHGSLRPLVLASASPRRAELLRAAGIAFEVVAADVDETPFAGEDAAVYVRRLAEAKASAVVARAPNRLVLAADTAVVVAGQILGKPADDPDARRMLQLLSGRTHEVLTGIALLDADRGASEGMARTDLARTVVEFAPLTAGEIDAYVRSGEPMDKAGAYAIQGLASRFVVRIDGSYSNVVGLPIARVYRLLRESGA